MSSNIRAVPNVVGAEVTVKGENVSIGNLVVPNADLAAYLNEFEGAEKALRIIELLEMAMYVRKLTNTSEDVREIQKVAQDVKAKLEEAGEGAFDDFEALLKKQTDENRPEALVSLLKSKLVSAVIAELDPTKETSPFNPIANHLKSLLAQNAAADATKAQYDNSREKGIDFEALLDQMIQKEALIHADDALFTGDVPSPSGDKTGDEVVTLNPSTTGGVELRVVWEAKTDAKFVDTKGRLKRDQVAKELNAAIANREAECGVFVADSRKVDLNVQPEWQEFEGNKLTVILDQDNPDQRIIRMAYLWSRAKALESIAPEDTDLDMEAIRRSLSDLNRQIQSLSTLRRHHTATLNGINASIGFVNDLEGNLEEIMESLNELMASDDEEIDE
jgi:hypothetical protein